MRRTPSPAATPSPVQTSALDIAAQQRKAQAGALAGVQGTVGQAKGTLASTAPALSRYTTPDATGQTPLRRSLQTSLTSSTTGAYNNALKASRLRGLQMGLQAQPMQAGNETAIEAQRAGALAKIPSQVEQQAAPLELQAIGQQTQQAGLENQLAGTELGVARTYNPESYFGTGAGMEAQRQQELNQQYLDQQRRNAGLWAGLAKAGLSFIPGQYAG